MKGLVEVVCRVLWRGGFRDVEDSRLERCDVLWFGLWECFLHIISDSLIQLRPPNPGRQSNGKWPYAF